MQTQQTIHNALILLTYKSKILLISKEKGFHFEDENVWSMLDKWKLKELQLNKLEKNLLATNLYHVKLTDENVNKINRENGYRLEFYNFSEIEKLELSKESRSAFLENKDLIKDTLFK